MNSININKKNNHAKPPSEGHQQQRPQRDKFTKMGRNQCKKAENSKSQNTSPPRKNQNSSPASEQSWIENDCDEMMELDFRRWITRNYCELKEHVLNQCKETKNRERKI